MCLFRWFYSFPLVVVYFYFILLFFLHGKPGVTNAFRTGGIGSRPNIRARSSLHNTVHEIGVDSAKRLFASDAVLSWNRSTTPGSKQREHAISAVKNYRRELVETNAAIAIQRVYRGYIVREKIFRAQVEFRNASARTIQAAFIGWKTRSYLRGLHKAAMVVQSLWHRRKVTSLNILLLLLL